MFSSMPLNVGIPLGSLLYIMDTRKISSKCNSILFADNLSIHFDDNSTEALSNVCNSELTDLYNWATANGLSIHLKKTYFLTFVNRIVTIPPKK